MQPPRTANATRGAMGGETGGAKGGESAAPATGDFGAASAGHIRMRVNGRSHEFVAGRDYLPGDTLATLLRDRLGLLGVKVACGQGACGACTVIMDGRAVLSCMTLAAQTDGSAVTTIEGLGEDDPLVVAFATQTQPGHGTALQCGFCTPGMVMTAKALLLRTPRPTREEVVDGMAGNICRCGCYAGIVEAVVRAGELGEARGHAGVAPEGSARAATSKRDGTRPPALRRLLLAARGRPREGRRPRRLPCRRGGGHACPGAAVRQLSAQPLPARPHRPPGREPRRGDARRPRRAHVQGRGGRPPQADQRQLDAVLHLLLRAHVLAGLQRPDGARRHRPLGRRGGGRGGRRRDAGGRRRGPGGPRHRVGAAAVRPRPVEGDGAGRAARAPGDEPRRQRLPPAPAPHKPHVPGEGRRGAGLRRVRRGGRRRDLATTTPTTGAWTRAGA